MASGVAILTQHVCCEALHAYREDTVHPMFTFAHVSLKNLDTGCSRRTVSSLPVSQRSRDPQKKKKRQTEPALGVTHAYLRTCNSLTRIDTVVESKQPKKKHVPPTSRPRRTVPS